MTNLEKIRNATDVELSRILRTRSVTATAMTARTLVDVGNAAVKRHGWNGCTRNVRRWKMNVLDFVSASIFLVCLSFLLLLWNTDLFRRPCRRMRIIEEIADALMIASLLYIVTMRLVPYAWWCIRGIA